VNAGVDVRHAHLWLEDVGPVVVAYVGLRRSRHRQTEYRCCQSTDYRSGDGGESELLHFDAFFVVSSVSNFLDRSDWLNRHVRDLIPMAEIDRRLAGID
jgi:hypothetical protein